MRNLCIIFSDQLNLDFSSLLDFDKELDEILMCEFKKDFTNLNHHKKKIVYQLSCMRHFQSDLTERGYRVNYIKIDDSNNHGDFIPELLALKRVSGFEQLIVTEPSSYDELSSVKRWGDHLEVSVDIRKNNLFMCDKEEFETWSMGRKELRLEYFYRKLRKKFNILMENEKPVCGTWNFDKINRKSLNGNCTVPEQYSSFVDDVTLEVIELVNREFNDHFGTTDQFEFAVNRKQALTALEKFLQERLESFGDYQDAMLSGEPWLFHSHLSMYLNNGLLNPRECIDYAENEYKVSKAPINSVEGFIRQILGWREYVRGLYWLKMPDYKNMNALNADASLPSFYWDADTKMNCIKESVENTMQNAYAHHIQRLMVLGNFSLIAGIQPKDVNDWFLSVYADAYEWVELPNVTGMALFADGGIIASKPYASTGAYINRMSNYCGDCHYDVKEKTGEAACPFNYLYWNFLERNQRKLSSNPRLGLAYKNLEKVPKEKLISVKKSAEKFLNKMGNCEKV